MHNASKITQPVNRTILRLRLALKMGHEGTPKAVVPLSLHFGAIQISEPNIVDIGYWVLGRVCACTTGECHAAYFVRSDVRLVPDFVRDQVVVCAVGLMQWEY